jgi:hypothetical protein
MAYSVHCSFCLWASLAPPGLLGADHAFCGILYLCHEVPNPNITIRNFSRWTPDWDPVFLRPATLQ